jgi:hypothetical protein
VALEEFFVNRDVLEEDDAPAGIVFGDRVDEQ